MWIIIFLGVNFRYEQAEFIERELEQVTEQIKSIIQTLNANQVSSSILNHLFCILLVLVWFKFLWFLVILNK